MNCTEIAVLLNLPILPYLYEICDSSKFLFNNDQIFQLDWNKQIYWIRSDYVSFPASSNAKRDDSEGSSKKTTDTEASPESHSAGKQWVLWLPYYHIIVVIEMCCLEKQAWH